MTYNEYLKDHCTHTPYRAVIMGGKIMHWRCRCGRIVPAPKEDLS